MAMRCNLICVENEQIKNHSAGHITTEEADELIRFLQEKLGSDRVHFYTGVQYRHLLVVKGGDKRLRCTPPHDAPLQPFHPLLIQPELPEAEATAALINELILKSQELLKDHPVNLRRMAEGKDPANSIWPWSPGYRPQMEPLFARFPRKRRGSVITAVDLIRGIGHYAGLRVILVEGATGLYDTHYENKVAAALAALKEDDFVYLHIEAPDEAGHEGNVELKIKTIEDLDRRVIAPIYEAVKRWDEPVAIAVLPDHPTPCELRTHTDTPIPFLIWAPDIKPDKVQVYDEESAQGGFYGLCHGAEFINNFLRSEWSTAHNEAIYYYSTNGAVAPVSLEEAVIKGLAADKGLFMPERIPLLPPRSFRLMEKRSFPDISLLVADAFWGADLPINFIHDLVHESVNFDVPLVPVTDRIYSLELFHGPTLAFKDVGGRVMARLLGHFIRTKGAGTVNVLVATSGDTGSAVANGFLGVEGIHVYVLYPKGKVSEIQEKQFTTLGQNITALEIDGAFDDCQALVKSAFMDEDLNARMQLTSANSINVARFLPQSFYYFYAYMQLKRAGRTEKPVVCVPSGNFGNLTAGLISKRMGLPIHRFIAANNKNDIFYQYLQTGHYDPRPSVPTIANAMDVGDPSNFARVLDLYKGDHKAITAEISGASYTDAQIRQTIRQVWRTHRYLLDPHGACGYRALEEGLRYGEVGIFLETAHPAKFLDTVQKAINAKVAIPEKLQAFLKGEKKSILLGKDFATFKDYLISRSDA
jgi:threonine synthase